jgi:hypothetical protein
VIERVRGRSSKHKFPSFGDIDRLGERDMVHVIAGPSRKFDACSNCPRDRVQSSSIPAHGHVH